MSLLTSGAIKVESFKNEQFISIADKDFTKAFARQSINGSPGYVIISDYVKKLRNCFLDLSEIDVIQIINDVSTEINRNGVDISLYSLSEIDALSEIGDKKKLNLHTDQIKDGILAILYIRGGDNTSGGGIYYAETHMETHPPGMHSVSPEHEKTIKHKELNLSGKAGDLIIYYINGFHSRYPTIRERRAFRLFFLKKDLDPINFDDFVIPLSQAKLAPEIMRYHKKRPVGKGFQFGSLYLDQNPPIIKMNTVFNVFRIWLSIFLKRFYKLFSKYSSDKSRHK